MKIKILFATLLTIVSIDIFAQQGGITGIVTSRDSKTRISNIEVILQSGGLHAVRYTDRTGQFTFDRLNAGVYKVLINAEQWLPVELSVTVGEIMKDMGTVSLIPEFAAAAIDDSYFDQMEADTESDDQSMPMVLSASKDVFNNIAAFKFSALRYRLRGYDSELANVFLNGIYINDAMTGYSPWSLWTGLNEATRNQENTYGGVITDYGVGDINGSTNINSLASQVRKGFRGSFVNANNMYRFRVMLTYGSGELDSGWSYALSVSTRQGGNDWVNGMFYNTWAYFASVEKRFGNTGKLSFTFMGTPGERAVRGGSTQEVYDLVESNFYNPNWGYQGGTGRMDMRSARIRRSHEPVAMINYFYNPDYKLSVQAAVSFRFGFNGYSAMEWHDAPDPRPDYYRYLPSYHLRPNDYYDEDKAAQSAYGWQTDWGIRQINWDKMYNINYNSLFEDDGTAYYNGVIPAGQKRSRYILEERRIDQRDLNAKVQVSTLIGKRGKLTVGTDFRFNRTEYFKEVKDLLGGDYFLDIDKFAERDFGYGDKRQNNLLTPDRLVKKGDKFGYDYYGRLQTDRLWATYKYTRRNLELFAGAESGHTRFWREGRYQKGLFPENSYGKSERQDFRTYSAKAGFNYRITGAQMVYGNFTYAEKAPYFANSFVSARTRNTVVPNIATEKHTSSELNYSLMLPFLRARLTGYYATIEDRLDLISFYDDTQQSFTNFAMSGIDQLHTGLEFGTSAPLGWNITAEGVLSYGYYKYDSNPYVTQTIDNSEKIVIDNQRVYWKNMKIESTPQTAANLGLKYYNPRNMLRMGVDVNYFDALYISMNPLYRMDHAHVGLTPVENQAMAKQERFGEAFVVNANAGKQWTIGDRYRLGVSVDVKNLLNDKTIKTGGYEQMRLYKVTEDAVKYRRFDPKYFYLMGTTYYMIVYLRF